MPRVLVAYPGYRVERIPRLLLALHCAGRRGIWVEDLLEQMNTSKATLYRDMQRIKDSGWRIDVKMERGRPGFRVAYSLSAWQKLPGRVRYRHKLKKPRSA